MKKTNGFANHMSERPERALVTGASSGIGREIARILASQGTNLVICARRQTELEVLATELNEKHGTESQIIISD
jgi:short-subunit dehydrogenase